MVTAGSERRGEVVKLKGLRKARRRLDQTPGLFNKIALIFHWARKISGSALYISLLREKKRSDAFYKRLLLDRRFAQDFVNDNLPVDFHSKLVLDAGCGRGRAAAALSLLGANAVGIDLTQHKFWHDARRASFVVADVASMPFSDASYDGCVCLSVLMYVKDDKDVLSEIYRVLKPGGMLVLQSANKGNLKSALTGRKLDPTHKRTYEKNEAESLVQRMGFKVRLSTAIGFYSPILTHLISDLITEKTWLLLGRLLPERYRGVLLMLCEKD
jgi:ubiquinone/menaquinone biosynthesis C-methylase UbiE